MEVVTIEKRVFEEMLARFESFARKAETIYLKYGQKKVEWFDNQDVCLLLNIGPRTLQTMRDNKTLPFTRINRKIYYCPKDVTKLIKKP